MGKFEAIYENKTIPLVGEAETTIGFKPVVTFKDGTILQVNVFNHSGAQEAVGPEMFDIDDEGSIWFTVQLVNGEDVIPDSVEHDTFDDGEQDTYHGVLFIHQKPEEQSEANI